MKCLDKWQKSQNKVGLKWYGYKENQKFDGRNTLKRTP